MKVFIENEAGSKRKNIYDEKTLVFQKQMEVARAYPFPYGFILDTTAEDGDNVDVFVLTTEKLRQGQLVDCEPIGLMEQFEWPWEEDSAKEMEVDHNVLAVLVGKSSVELNAKTMALLRDFVLHVFNEVKQNKTQVGGFLDKNAAREYIKQHQED